MGEPAGIGGELTLLAWLARHAGPEPLPAFVALDDPQRLGGLAAACGWKVPIVPVAAPEQAMAVFASALPVFPVPLPAPVVPGRPQPAAAAAVLASLDTAIAWTRTGRAAALVTNPIHKASLYAAGFRYPGHTEHLAAAAGLTTAPVMMLVGGGLRVVPVTIHMALREVFTHLTPDAIIHACRVTATALRQDFGLARPRLALAALNPHAGEAGAMGTEEITLLAPALAALRREGLDIAGPAAADTLFHPAARAGYDAAVCMYHDQALIPLKTLAFDEGVNVTLGLPFIRTSPDHGTAFAIAGQGIASPASLMAALRLARTLAAVRTATSHAGTSHAGTGNAP